MISKVEYFGADWCGPCKAFKPLVSEACGDILEIHDIDNEQALAVSRHVRSVPTTIFYDEEGDEVKRIVGAKPKSEIIKTLATELI